MEESDSRIKEGNTEDSKVREENKTEDSKPQETDEDSHDKTKPRQWRNRHREIKKKISAI